MYKVAKKNPPKATLMSEGNKTKLTNDVEMGQAKQIYFSFFIIIL